MRLCIDCGVGIGHRHPHTRRCTHCGNVSNRKPAVPRLCMDCGEDISRRGRNSIRCESCQRKTQTGHTKTWRLHRQVIDRLKGAVPVVQPLDMTPQQVIEIDGQQFVKVWGGGEGLTAVGARGSRLVEGPGRARRNGSTVFAGVRS